MIKRKLYYLLSPSLRLLARRLYYFPVDLFETLTGRRDKNMPPRGLVYIGSGDFKKTGQDLLQQVTEKCDLKPDARVLDVGCGIGRLAFPLTNFLSQKGSYEGFDVVKTGIDWCNKHIKSKYPNFNFLYVDLKNDLYNLKTSNEASEFIFPYPDSDFDQIILTSVFTHMMPQDVANYMKQISRVLKPGGKCFATFFILNQESENLSLQNGAFHFPYSFDNYSLMDKNVKEANIAFEEEFLLTRLCRENGLKADEVLYGWWPGRNKEEFPFFQDTLILSRLNK